MTKLQCRLCGGALVMDESWDFAQCEKCGMKYTKESIQKMLFDPEFADVKNTSIDTFLFKAEQQLQTGHYTEAKKTYQWILDNIDPLSSDAWWGLLRCRFHYTDMYLKRAARSRRNNFSF